MADHKLQLPERQTADFELIANGGFAPLTGFQGSEDWKSVVEDMKLTSGDYWPIPTTARIWSAAGGRAPCLRRSSRWCGPMRLGARHNPWTSPVAAPHWRR